MYVLFLCAFLASAGNWKGQSDRKIKIRRFCCPYLTNGRPQTGAAGDRRAVLPDHVNLAYSEHARRYLADCGLPKERTYVTGSPMAEVLTDNLEQIQSSDIHARLGLEKGKYILLSAHREENIDTEKNFTSIGYFFGDY